MSKKDISTMYTKELNKKTGRKGWVGWKTEKEITRGQMTVVKDISDVEVEIAEIEAGRLVEIELGGYCE